jgi:hypothetical protein
MRKRSPLRPLTMQITWITRNATHTSG